MKNANCIDCFYMKVKNEKAKCVKGHFYVDSGEKIFNCKKQLERYGWIVGFELWKNKECNDFYSMDGK